MTDSLFRDALGPDYKQLLFDNVAQKPQQPQQPQQQQPQAQQHQMQVRDTSHLTLDTSSSQSALGVLGEYPWAVLPHQIRRAPATVTAPPVQPSKPTRFSAASNHK